MDPRYQEIINKLVIETTKKPGQRLTIWGFIGYLVLISGAFLCLAPLLWLADSSFRPRIEIFSMPPVILQKPIWEAFSSYTLQTFGEALALRADLSFFNSVYVTVFSVLLTLLVCSLAAYAFAFLKFPGRNFLFFFSISTMMLPTMTLLAAYFKVIQTVGLYNNILGIIIPYAGSAMGIFLLRQYYIRIPYSLYEAAVVDGANKFYIWWNIVIPLSKPALSALAIYQFRYIWNDFLVPMLILRDERIFTLPIKLQLMDSFNFNKPYGAIIATGFVSALIPIVFFLIFRRQFIEGFTGGVKG
ncbi:MAG: carbohydrate ABC transporter permease [Firmicutes bacterium]|nr:carbohydrate ABC transporter permease [Bacillota bacterium]